MQRCYDSKFCPKKTMVKREHSEAMLRPGVLSKVLQEQNQDSGGARGFSASNTPSQPRTSERQTLHGAKSFYQGYFPQC